MNTSKQVNAMIGLLFVTVVIFAANVLNEPARAENAREHQIETFAERGAELFVANCRNCHGLEGLGTDEGAIGLPVNKDAFLILEKDNAYGADATAEGVAVGIRDFLRNTISCGRKGTQMPPWSEHFGGSLSDQQIDYLVTLITYGRWDLVVEIGHDTDSHQVPPATRESIISDGSGLAVTQENCGQYDALTARPYRQRDPFASSAAATGDGGASPAPATGEAPAGGGPADALVQGLTASEYYQTVCAACHGLEREGQIGLPLTPDELTEPAEFYIDTLTNGRADTAMLPFGSGPPLTPAEVEAMVTFLTTVDP